MCSLNNYKPSVALNSYGGQNNFVVLSLGKNPRFFPTCLGNVDTFQANSYESLMSVNQSLSRNARLSSTERDGLSNSTRVYFLSKSNAYPGAAFQIANILREKFEVVYVIDLK